MLIAANDSTPLRVSERVSSLLTAIGTNTPAAEKQRNAIVATTHANINLRKNKKICSARHSRHDTRRGNFQILVFTQGINWIRVTNPQTDRTKSVASKNSTHPTLLTGGGGVINLKHLLSLTWSLAAGGNRPTTPPG